MEKPKEPLVVWDHFLNENPKHLAFLCSLRKNKKFELFGLWTSKTQQKQTAFEESKNPPKENKNNNTT